MKYISMILVVFIATLCACSKATLESPCPNYGRACVKHPVNSWDYLQGAYK